MSTLITTNVWAEITEAAKGTKTPSQVAVAYFSSKGPYLLPLSKGSVLVADVSVLTVAQGATSPAALEQMRKVGIDIYSVQYLHAKAFAFDNVAFVGSTNASQSSSTKLVEASSKTVVKSEIAEVRGFVQSLCLTRLSQSDLKQLSSFYNAPKFDNPPPAAQRRFSTLLMQLTLEQGVDRASQVQPPKSVWATFFDLTFPDDTPPVITLTNKKTMVSETRPVVKHHHTYTLEISDADLPRPAIIEMRRVGQKKYSYLVHRPNDLSFSNANIS